MTTVGVMELGRVGVWWSGSWRPEHEAGQEPAAELEAMGYGALWSSGGFEPGLSPRFERLLRLTSTIVVASGIVSIWAASPEEVSSGVDRLERLYPGRFLLGIGTSHAALVGDYEKPLARMREFLDRRRRPRYRQKRASSPRRAPAADAKAGDRALAASMTRSGG